MNTSIVVSPSESFVFPYYCIRRISAPEDLENGREVYSGHALAKSYLDLPDNENIREYMLDVEGKKRRRPTDVHRAMKETLENAPDAFSILNGGIVIVARNVNVDDKKKIAYLERPSIINGSQTQGVLADYFRNKEENGQESYPVHVKFEIIVTQDDDLIAETSIARNFQNDVMKISIVGRLGQLDELEESFQKVKPGAKLRKSETKLSDDYVMTEKLLQVITALVPDKLWPYDNEAENPNKVFTYSMKAKCLKDFQKVWEVTHKKIDLPQDKKVKYEQLYSFYLDIAPEAWDLYQKWKTHQGFQGTGLRALQREGRKIADVPDGIVFPILASLSAFAIKNDGKWTIAPPDSFSDKELIQAAVQVYQEIAKSNPNKMGKAKPCYSALYQITSIYRRLSRMK